MVRSSNLPWLIAQKKGKIYCGFSLSYFLTSFAILSEPNSTQTVENDLHDHIMDLTDRGVHEKLRYHDPLESVEFSS